MESFWNTCCGIAPGRGRKSTRPGANGVVELTPFEFLAPPGRSRAATAEAPPSLPRGVCAESQAQAHRLGHGLRRREKNATAGGCAAFWQTASGRPKHPISLLKGSPSAGRPVRKCH